MGRSLVALGVCLAVAWGPLATAGCGAVGRSAPDLTLAASDAFASLGPLVESLARQHGYRVEITWLGSVDIMLALREAACPYDAVWPAHSAWLDLGDAAFGRLRHVESIVRSPLVWGVRRGRAEALGLLGREVTIGELLGLIAEGSLRLAVADAARSHVGAMATLAALASQAGAQGALTAADLETPGLDGVLAGLYPPGSEAPAGAGWLLDAYLAAPEAYDGMVNAEALLVVANQELLRRGLEPLVALYPPGGLALLDGPLAYLDRAEPRKERVFLDLQAGLLGEEGGRAARLAGWRTGTPGLAAGGPDGPLLDPAWQVDLGRRIVPLALPGAEVLRGALTLAQRAVRAPILTVYVLDTSLSMAGEGQRGLDEVMAALLGAGGAAAGWMPIGPRDTTAVIAFGAAPTEPWTARGDAPAPLADLLERIRAQAPAGHSDLYSPLIAALRLVGERAADPAVSRAAIILVTDGQGRSAADLRLLRRAWEEAPRRVPVQVVLVGAGVRREVNGIAALSGGGVYEGAAAWTAALRAAWWGVPGAPLGYSDG